MRPSKVQANAFILFFVCAIALPSASATPPTLFPQHTALPRIIQGEEGRVLMAAGDKLYTEPLGSPPASHYYLLRPGPAITHADTTDNPVRGSIYLGKAALLHGGNPAVLRVEQARREIRPGDFLMPIAEAGANHDG